MRLEIRAIILTVVIALITIPVFAQSSMKIAVVDTDKAFKESIWGKKAMEELEAELAKWQEKGEQLDREIAALEEQLATQSSFIDDKEAEQQLQNEISSKKLQGQTLVQQGNAVLEEKRRQTLDPISEEIKNLIKKLAMSNDYDLILEKQVFVLYLNPELDITSKVIVMLDEAYQQRAVEKPKDSKDSKDSEEKTSTQADEKKTQ